MVPEVDGWMPSPRGSIRKESGVAVTVTPYKLFSLRAVPTVSQEPDPAERRGLAVVQALSAVKRRVTLRPSRMARTRD